LGDENAVERIAVMKRHFGDLDYMLQCELQHCDRISIQLISKEITEGLAYRVCQGSA
jgi:hypothetical protein